MIFEMRTGVKENLAPFSPAGGLLASPGASDYSFRNQLASSFPARRINSPQATAPVRAAVWLVPPAAPLAATEHWRCGLHWPRQNGPFARRH
jgi:hypothetical protein